MSLYVVNVRGTLYNVRVVYNVRTLYNVRVVYNVRMVYNVRVVYTVRRVVYNVCHKCMRYIVQCTCGVHTCTTRTLYIVHSTPYDVRRTLY